MAGWIPRKEIQDSQLHSVLFICRFCTCEFAYLLTFIYILQINALSTFASHLQKSTQWQKCDLPNLHVPCWIDQDVTLPHCFCSHTVNVSFFVVCLLLLLSWFSRVQLSSVPGIPQARILEWVAISFSNACMHAKSLQSCPTLCNPVDSSPQAPPSTRFSRQEYWSGLPLLSPVVYLVPCFLYMGFTYISVGK